MLLYWMLGFVVLIMVIIYLLLKLIKVVLVLLVVIVMVILLVYGFDFEVCIVIDFVCDLLLVD